MTATPNPSRSVSPEPTKGECQVCGSSAICCSVGEQAFCADCPHEALDASIAISEAQTSLDRYAPEGTALIGYVEARDEYRTAIEALTASAYIPLVEAAEALVARDDLARAAAKERLAAQVLVPPQKCASCEKPAVTLNTDATGNWNTPLRTSPACEDHAQFTFASFGPRLAPLRAALVQVPRQQQADTEQGGV